MTCNFGVTRGGMVKYANTEFNLTLIFYQQIVFPLNITSLPETCYFLFNVQLVFFADEVILLKGIIDSMIPIKPSSFNLVRLLCKN